MSLNPSYRAKAVAWANGLDPEVLRARVEARLLGQESVPLFGHDDYPEEVVIELLLDQSEGLSSAAVDAIRAGCVGAAGQLARVFVSDELDDGQAASVSRVLRVAEATGLRQLGRFVALFTNSAASGIVLNDRLFEAATRAATTSFRDKSALGYWLRLAEDRRVCAVAFRQVMAIDPFEPQLMRLLDRYWRGQISENWEVDTPLLLRDLARRRNDPAIIGDVLSKIQYRLRPAVLECLNRRGWSRGWKEYLSTMRVVNFSQTYAAQTEEDDLQDDLSIFYNFNFATADVPSSRVLH